MSGPSGIGSVRRNDSGNPQSYGIHSSRLEDRLNPSPIHRALSSMRKNGAQTLLIGGHAFVLCGVTEFRRVWDLLIPTYPNNPERIQVGLTELHIQPSIVPASAPPGTELLRRRGAVRFRCHRPDFGGLRIDKVSRPGDIAEFGDPLERELEQFRHELQRAKT